MSNDNNEPKVEVLEGEEHLLMDHNYDGIKELDHPLPSWWLAIFYITIVFAAGYYAYYTFMGGPTLKEELVVEMKAVNEAKQAWEAKNNQFNLDEYNAFIAGMDKKTKKKIKKIYRRKCKACHGKDGGGGVGPNLTDNYWKNGDGSPAAVYKIIDKGVVDKGMEAWGERLGKEKVMGLVDYVAKFQGTTPKNPKEPEGELYE